VEERDEVPSVEKNIISDMELHLASITVAAVMKTILVPIAAVIVILMVIIQSRTAGMLHIILNIK
jgi:hypothetical protein